MKVKDRDARRWLVFPTLLYLACLTSANAAKGQGSLGSDGYPKFLTENNRRGEMEIDCDVYVDFCKEKEEERRLKRLADGEENTCLDTYMELACYPSFCCKEPNYAKALDGLAKKLNDNGCVDKINPHWTPISVAMWKHVSQCSPDEETYCIGDSKCDCAYTKNYNTAAPDCCCSPEYMPVYGCDGAKEVKKNPNSSESSEAPTCCNNYDRELTHWCRTPQLCASDEAEFVEDCPPECGTASTSVVGQWTNGFCQALNDEYDADKYYALMDDHELDKHKDGGRKRIRSVKYVCLKTSRNVEALTDSSQEFRQVLKGEDASMGIFLYEQEDCNAETIKQDISGGIKSWDAGSEPYFMRLVLPSAPCVGGTSFITCKYNPTLAAHAGDNEGLSDIKGIASTRVLSYSTMMSILVIACWSLASSMI